MLTILDQEMINNPEVDWPFAFRYCLMYSEEKLVVKLILKDINAMNFAYRKYGPGLYGVICKHSPDQADEVFIRSFTRFFNTVKDYDSSKCRLFTWMYQIVMDEIKNNHSR